MRRLAARLMLTGMAVLLGTIGLPAAAQDVRLDASVDRPTIHENESFTYVLRAEGRIGGQPDVSAVERDFDVLNRSSNTRIQTVNGRTEQVAEWIYQLMPRGTGTFTLPAVQLGDLISNDVTIEVLPAPVATTDAPSDIFMEVELDRDSAYVQSQVIYTLRLFTGVGIGRATLTTPQISGGEAIVERLGEDTQYQTTRGNRTFLVRERRFAIFPQASGQLTIGPSTFEAMVIPNRGFSRVQRLRSEALELEVKPAVAPPASHPNAAWLPAISLELDERWTDQADSFALGVPRTRVLSIVARGLLETQLPELDLGRAEGIRQYPDQPELERQVTDAGIEAKRIERFAVIAQAPGNVTIPAAEVPWWNVAEERWEIARIEPQELSVLPGNESLPEPESPSAPVARPPPAPAGPGAWPWISAGLALAWLVTAAGWMLDRRSRDRAAVAARAARKAARPPSGRSLLKQLRAACRVDDAERVQSLLLEWARLQFPDAPPTSLGALAERLPESLRAEVASLEAALYGRGGASWSGAKLAERLAETNAVTRKAGSDPDDPLTPLYR